VTVFASAGDAAHWLSPEVASRAPEGAQRFFQMARDGVAPYVQADRFKTFTGDAEILPGIAPVLSHGHTPGHTSYLLRSRGQQLLVWGDIVHNAAVQFARPTVTIEFDSDSRQALATRLKLLGWTARDALMVAAPTCRSRVWARSGPKARAALPGCHSTMRRSHPDRVESGQLMPLFATDGVRPTLY